jgi:hypothetical protein
MDGSFSGGTNEQGQECVDEKWISIRSDGVRTHYCDEMIDDNQSTFKAVGGGFTDSADYLAVGDFCADSARRLFIKVTVPEGVESEGAVFPKLVVQYNVENESSSSESSSSISSASVSESSSLSSSESKSSSSSSSESSLSSSSDSSSSESSLSSSSESSSSSSESSSESKESSSSSSSSDESPSSSSVSSFSSSSESSLSSSSESSLSSSSSSISELSSSSSSSADSKSSESYQKVDLVGHDWTTTTNGDMTISDSSHVVTFDAWKCADGGLSTDQYWVADATTGWAKVDLGSGNQAYVVSVDIVVNTIPEPNRAPKNFTIQGSNNDSDWDTLATVTNETSWGSGESRNFPLDDGGWYRYFKIDITLNNGDSSYVSIGEFYFWGDTTPD